MMHGFLQFRNKPLRLVLVHVVRLPVQFILQNLDFAKLSRSITKIP